MRRISAHSRKVWKIFQQQQLNYIRKQQLNLNNIRKQSNNNSTIRVSFHSIVIDQMVELGGPNWQEKLDENVKKYLLKNFKGLSKLDFEEQKHKLVLRILDEPWW
jgi:hypothetical protein